MCYRTGTPKIVVWAPSMMHIFFASTGSLSSQRRCPMLSLHRLVDPLFETLVRCALCSAWWTRSWIPMHYSWSLLQQLTPWMTIRSISRTESRLWWHCSNPLRWLRNMWNCCLWCRHFMCTRIWCLNRTIHMCSRICYGILNGALCAAGVLILDGGGFACSAPN